MWGADVINVSGHRLSTAEIESALIMHKGVAETAGVLFSSFFCTFCVRWIDDVGASHRDGRRADRPSRARLRHPQTVRPGVPSSSLFIYLS